MVKRKTGRRLKKPKEGWKRGKNYRKRVEKKTMREKEMQR